MKKFIYILGIILLNLLMAGLIFKMNHWPGAGVLITFSVGLLLIVFFPLAILNSYQKQSNKKHTALHGVAYFTVLIILAGVLFKIMHWPGAGVLLLIGLPLPFILFFPMYLRFHKNTEKKYDLNFFGVIFFLLFLAVFGALLALQASKDVVDGFAKVADNTTPITRNMEDRIENYYKNSLDSLEESSQRKQIQSYYKMGDQLNQSIEKLKKQLAVDTDIRNEDVLTASGFSWMNLYNKDQKNANYLFWDEENDLAGKLLEQYNAFMKETEKIMQNNGNEGGIKLPADHSPESYIEKGYPGTSLIANIMVLSQWQQHIRQCELEVLKSLQN